MTNENASPNFLAYFQARLAGADLDTSMTAAGFNKVVSVNHDDDAQAHDDEIIDHVTAHQQIARLTARLDQAGLEEAKSIALVLADACAAYAEALDHTLAGANPYEA